MIIEVIYHYVVIVVFMPVDRFYVVIDTFDVVIEGIAVFLAIFWTFPHVLWLIAIAENGTNEFGVAINLWVIIFVQ